MPETIRQPWRHASREHPSVLLGQKRRRGGHVEQERITYDGRNISREWRIIPPEQFAKTENTP